jgi:hypothetical protein
VQVRPTLVIQRELAPQAGILRRAPAGVGLRGQARIEFIRHCLVMVGHSHSIAQMFDDDPGINLASTGDTSTVTLAAEFTGAMIVGPISAAVEKNATAELETSLARLRDLAA